MKFIKKFNESNKDNKQDLACLQAARECVEAHEVALDIYKDKNDEETVIELTQSLMACELYIYSCEYKTDNLNKVADFVLSILNTDIDEVKSTSLKLKQEIQKCDYLKD